MVGPVDCGNSAGVCRRGRSGNSPVPAHMGAWPEREAPAEIFASADITVEKGMDSSIPFSFWFPFVKRGMAQMWHLCQDTVLVVHQQGC